MGGSVLSADALARVTNDKPLILSSNVIANASVIRWTEAGTITSTDRTDASYPVTRFYDRYLHIDSRPSTQTTTTWYIAMDLGASVAAWDTLFIGGHNFGTETGVTVTLEIDSAGSPDGSFGSTTTLATLSPAGSNKRLAAVVLSDTSTAKSWSSTRYVRLKLTRGSNFTAVPQIGELWLGPRRHLPYKFDVELDDKRTRSEVVNTESRSGVITRYVLSRGRAVRSGSMIIDAAADITTIDSFWEDIEQGTRPFLYMEQPTTSIHDVQLMSHQGGELDFPLVGPAFRRFGLDMIECAPFVVLE